MGTSEFIFLLFFFSSSSSSSAFILSAAQNDCIPSVCSRNQPIIKFPFQQEDLQPQRCGYPGFDIKCSNLGETVLRLPLSGDFIVRDIDYFTQEILLYDPDNCLPKRILKLDLSGSPFVSEFSQNFTFLNCTSDLMRSLLTPISCLSSSNHTIYAVSTLMLGESLLDSCKVITTALIPIAWPPQYRYGPSADISNDLRLVWHQPYCPDCESRGAVCGFKNNTSLETGCINLPSTGEESTSGHTNPHKRLALGLGIPALTLTIMAITYLCVRVTARFQPPRSSLTPGLPHPPILTIGMDRATIESYPMVVLGESRRHPRPDDSTCSICLAEYHANDTLRCIPKCQHCFHADCVDKWLRMNATCPVCRNSLTKPTDAV